MREKCRSGRRAIGSISAALCILCGWPILAESISIGSEKAGTVQGPVISVTSNLVVLPVSVVDRKGAFVSGLKLENFAVFEDGKQQKIAFFRQEDTPVTVGLLVDHSGSMGEKLPEVAVAAEAFAQSSNPDDEMFVVNFGDDVSLPSFAGKPFTSDAGNVRRAIQATRAVGRTALYDAIAAGLNQLVAGNHERKALVVVSDGGDDASHSTYREVALLARESRAAVYAVGLIGGLFEDQDPAVLRHLAQETGGIAYFPSETSEVGEISEQIAHDLREQYTIAYEPAPNAGHQSFRKIEVRLIGTQGRKLRVRSRTGYVPPHPAGMDEKS